MTSLPAAPERKSHSHPPSLICNAPPQDSNNNPPKNRNRNSFHRDVHEALNSLLWQPYEYQNTSCCSSCTSTSDLDANKDVRAETVNNPSGRASQWRAPLNPRDPISASRLSSRRASSSPEDEEDGGTSCESDCDVSSSADQREMHLQVNAEPPPPPPVGRALSSANVVGLPPPTAYHARNGSEPCYNTQYQRYSNGNAVVPLAPPPPVHLRSASVPGGLTPHHQRMSSEPRSTPAVHNVRASEPRSSTTTNVSNVNVNFYRAVPVNVVSAVPTIQCLNTLNNNGSGNNVSNVQIMPLGTTSGTTTTQVTIHTPRARTFTSTEAQTDDCGTATGAAPVEPPPPTREQRRKERRERRHHRRAPQRHTVDSGTNTQPPTDRLPDLLHSHMPPPYSPPPHTGAMAPPPPPPVLQSVVASNGVPSGLVAFSTAPPPPGHQLVQGSVPVAVAVPPPSGFRFPFPAAGFRRGRFSEEPPKGCCGLLSWKPGSLRWFIAVIALVAVCCVLVGTALGAMRPAGRDHLTVSLLMIGVGIVLVTVSGVAWRLTSHDSATCRSMLGLGSTESVDVCTRRFVPRLPPSYGRPHHPYAAMMYPEFQYRPPPPSYQASMQEYRLRLLLLDRGNTPQIQGAQNAISPPPTYRSHAGSLLRAPLTNRRDAAHSEYSCPPSYRSQTSAHCPLPTSVLHSREHSLSLSESNHESMINVVNILGSTEEDIALDNMALDSLKMEPESDLNHMKMMLKAAGGDLEGSKDGNLVTIVQTSDQSPVIVTVSGSSQLEGSHLQITDISSEMEILAHL